MQTPAQVSLSEPEHTLIGVETHERAPRPTWTSPPQMFARRRFGLEAARRYCRKMAREHYENFPVAMGLLGRRERDALTAIYAFARTADDFADEPQFEGVRAELLDDWEAQLERCYRGEATHPVMIALSEVIGNYAIPKELLLKLLDAFRQDGRISRYDSFDDLLDYCERSANPVGRLVLRVLGWDELDCLRWSDCICTALQLANFWQDISVDARKGRIYIPLEDLRRFRVSEDDVLEGRPNPRLGALVRFEVARTRSLFREGFPLLRKVGYPASLYLAGVWVGGRSVLRLVDDLGDRAVCERPTLSGATLARAFVNAGVARIKGGAP